MKRRSFLGSAIGLVAGVPLIAKSVAVGPKVDPAAIFKGTPPDLSKFRSAIRLSGGEVVEGPGLKVVQFGRDVRTFLFKDINITETVTAKSAILLDPEGRLMHEMPFSGGSQSCHNGDTLKVTLTVRKYDL